MSQDRKAMLENVGKVLYGERWQTGLARDLGLPDGRRIRQWLADERPIPGGIQNALRHLLEERKGQIEAALKAIAE